MLASREGMHVSIVQLQLRRDSVQDVIPVASYIFAACMRVRM